VKKRSLRAISSLRFTCSAKLLLASSFMQAQRRCEERIQGEKGVLCWELCAQGAGAYPVGKRAMEGRLVGVEVLELQQADLAQRRHGVVRRLSRQHQLHSTEALSAACRKQVAVGQMERNSREVAKAAQAQTCMSCISSLRNSSMVLEAIPSARQAAPTCHAPAKHGSPYSFTGATNTRRAPLRPRSGLSVQQSCPTPQRACWPAGYNPWKLFLFGCDNSKLTSRLKPCGRKDSSDTFCDLVHICILAVPILFCFPS
jgi:hypothetical protein